MKLFATLSLASISLAVANPKKSGSLLLRGNQQRGHSLQDDTECVLYINDIQFIDRNGEQSWSCKFPRELAQNNFGGQDIMGVRGVSSEAIESAGAVSGEHFLKTRGAYVAQYLGSSSFVELVVPEDSFYTIERLPEADPRREGQRQAMRQQGALTSSLPRTLRTLVVRVVDGSGNAPRADADQLRDDVFEDSVSLATQFAACSKDQLVIAEASGVSVGVGVGEYGIVNVTIAAIAHFDSRIVLEREARARAEELYGGDDGLQHEYDLVLFCLPPGTGDWVGYAYINRWDSYYNDRFCSSVSVLMHEVGHNLNLAHSGDTNNKYGDESGIMGYSYDLDDGPEKCFNAAKNYQLGWYELQEASIDPLDTIGSPRAFVLNGVDDYKKDGSSDGELIILRLEQYGDDDNGGADYYVGYNRKSGPNRGVSEAGDKITVFVKTRGGPDGYGPSTRIAAMGPGEHHEIPNYKGTDTNVYVYVHWISSDERDAFIIVSAGELVTKLPTASPGCVDDPQWKYLGKRGKGCGWIGEGYTKRKCKKLDGDRPVYDICPATCSSVGLGPCSDNDENNDENNDNDNDNDENSNDEESNNRCRDDLFFRYRNDPDKTCRLWVAGAKSPRILKKRCNKPVEVEVGGSTSSRVLNYCRDTCGRYGLGSCAGLVLRV